MWGVCGALRSLGYSYQLTYTQLLTGSPKHQSPAPGMTTNKDHDSNIHQDGPRPLHIQRHLHQPPSPPSQHNGIQTNTYNRTTRFLDRTDVDHTYVFFRTLTWKDLDDDTITLIIPCNFNEPRLAYPSSNPPRKPSNKRPHGKMRSAIIGPSLASHGRALHMGTRHAQRSQELPAVLSQCPESAK